MINLSSESQRRELAAVLQKHLDTRRDEHLALLEDLCNIHCGSEMLEGVGQVVDRVAQRLEEMGLDVTRHGAENYGDHLVAETGATGPCIVLGGHLDTTYTDYSGLPRFHLDGEFAIGPGTADMKGGVVVFLAALSALAEAGLLARVPVTVIFNTDEERGAPSSRQLFIQQAAQCRAALFSECAGPRGEIVVSRRAKLSYSVKVRGEGKHAGAKDLVKVSALKELAHKILALEGLNNQFEGASFNVGRAWGGIASNTVAERAEALMDIRYPQTRQEQPIREAVEAICSRAQTPGALTTLEETSFRPAWGRGAASLGLFERARGLAVELGYEAVEESRGGTADSNWFGAAGVPTLDGLGPVGFDDHTPGERMELASFFQRPLLVAMLVTALGSDGP